MSVTFFLKNHHETIRVINSGYNPEEPEDEFYNPKYLEENKYFDINISNINAGILLRALKRYDPELVGEISFEDLPKFKADVDELAIRVLQDDFDEEIDRTRMMRYVRNLNKLIREAQLLKDTIIWS